MKKFKNLRRAICLVLAIVCILDSINNPITVKATTQNVPAGATTITTAKYNCNGAGEWKNYYYVNNHGKYCYNRYFYPAGASDYGIPEYYFQTPGIRSYKGGLGNYSYTVICDEPSGTPPNNNPENKYVNTAYVVYIEDANEPEDLAGPTKKGKGNITFTYVDCNGTSAVYIFPTSRGKKDVKPMIELAMGRTGKNNTSKTYNPDLFTTCRAEYSVHKTLNLGAKDYADILGDVIALTTGFNAKTIVSKGAKYGAKILTADSSAKSVGLTETYATSYMKDAEKLRSLSLEMNKKVRLDPNDKVSMFYDYVYPWDMQGDYYKKKRHMEARFSFSIRSCLGNKDITDIYGIEYEVSKATDSKTAKNINIDKNGKTATSSNAALVKVSNSLKKDTWYTESQIKNAISVKYNNRAVMSQSLHYEIKISRNSKKKTAEAKIQGKNGFKGTHVTKIKLTYKKSGNSYKYKKA